MPAGFEDEKGAEVGWALGSKWKKRGDDHKQVWSEKWHFLLWVLTSLCSCCVENSPKAEQRDQLEVTALFLT